MMKKKKKVQTNDNELNVTKSKATSEDKFL